MQRDWNWRWDTGADWVASVAPRISRAAVITALDRRVALIPAEVWRDAQITGCDGERLVAVSEGQGGAFDLVVDATGAHRSTLAMLDGMLPEVRLEDAGRPARYRTALFALPQPATSMTWRSSPADDPTGALYGECEEDRLRITGSVPLVRDRRITSAGDIAALFGERIGALVAPGARLIGRSSTIAPQIRRLVVAAGPVPGWIAFGDARVQWAPRSGTGLSSIFRQGRVLSEALKQTGDVRAIRARLDDYVETTWANAAANLDALSAGVPAG